MPLEPKLVLHLYKTHERAKQAMLRYIRDFCGTECAINEQQMWVINAGRKNLFRNLSAGPEKFAGLELTEVFIDEGEVPPYILARVRPHA